GEDTSRSGPRLLRAARAPPAAETLRARACSVGLVKTLDLLAGLVDTWAPDEWYVTDGATAVGPVGLELLARGISAGRVPPDAFVRHASWGNWRGLAYLVEQDPSFDARRTLTPLRAPRKEPPRETLDSIDVMEEADA